MPYPNLVIVPERTAMIVVDMQNDFVAEGARLHSRQALLMVPKLAATLQFCRQRGIRIIYSAHVHRRDGSDLGPHGELHPAEGERTYLVDGTPGVEIYPALAPQPGEHVIKKHRFSAFYGTDLDIILRQWRIETLVISGTTTENCCHATARDAMFRNYRVVFLSDVTGTFDYPDTGFGRVQAEEIHRVTLAILNHSTSSVMTAEEFMGRVDDRTCSAQGRSGESAVMSAG